MRSTDLPLSPPHRAGGTSCPCGGRCSAQRCRESARCRPHARLEFPATGGTGCHLCSSSTVCQLWLVVPKPPLLTSASGHAAAQEAAKTSGTLVAFAPSAKPIRVKPAIPPATAITCGTRRADAHRQRISDWRSAGSPRAISAKGSGPRYAAASRPRKRSTGSDYTLEASRARARRRTGQRCMTGPSHAVPAARFSLSRDAEAPDFQERNDALDSQRRRP